MTTIVRNLGGRSKRLERPRWRGVIGLALRPFAGAARGRSLIDLAFRRRRRPGVASTVIHHHHHHGHAPSVSVVQHHHHPLAVRLEHSHPQRLPAKGSTPRLITQVTLAASIRPRARGSRPPVGSSPIVRHESLRVLMLSRERSLVERPALVPRPDMHERSMLQKPGRSWTSTVFVKPLPTPSDRQSREPRIPAHRRPIDIVHPLAKTRARMMPADRPNRADAVPLVKRGRFEVPETPLIVRARPTTELSLTWRARPALASAVLDPGDSPASRSPHRAVPREASPAAVASPAQLAGTLPKPQPLTTTADLPPALIDQLADDVMRRMDRRMRIERERRGM